MRRAGLHLRSGLKSYRARDFATAIADFEKVVSLRTQDQASSRMIDAANSSCGADRDGWDTPRSR